MNNRFNSSLDYSYGEVSLESEQNPILVEIKYRGVIEAESSLPPGFVMSEKNKTIYVIRFVNEDMPNKLFKYNGDFYILQVKCYTKNNISFSSITTKVDIWENKNSIRDFWERHHLNWEDYDKVHSHNEHIIGNKRSESGWSNRMVNNIKKQKTTS